MKDECVEIIIEADDWVELDQRKNVQNQHKIGVELFRETLYQDDEDADSVICIYGIYIYGLGKLIAILISVGLLLFIVALVGGT